MEPPVAAIRVDDGGRPLKSFSEKNGTTFKKKTFDYVVMPANTLKGLSKCHSPQRGIGYWVAHGVVDAFEALIQISPRLCRGSFNFRVIRVEGWVR